MLMVPYGGGRVPGRPIGGWGGGGEHLFYRTFVLSQGTKKAPPECSGGAIWGYLVLGGNVLHLRLVGLGDLGSDVQGYLIGNAVVNDRTADVE
jgi:hypothetical protein